MAIAAATARAQTVANGPYYAPPSWDQTLPVATRFIVLSNMGSNAVLDRETGLVWEKSPATAPLDWLNAQFHCNQSAVGGRRGWRLPTLQDISSLIDPNAPSSVVIPVLPAGHPFTNVLANAYWSATTNAGATDEAWGTNFNGAAELRSPKTDSLRVWCVRGGQGSDPQ